VQFGRLLEQLARQGWRLRPDDSMLVNAEPVRDIPVSAPFLRSHPVTRAEQLGGSWQLRRLEIYQRT